MVAQVWPISHICLAVGCKSWLISGKWNVFRHDAHHCQIWLTKPSIVSFPDSSSSLLSRKWCFQDTRTIFMDEGDRVYVNMEFLWFPWGAATVLCNLLGKQESNFNYLGAFGIFVFVSIANTSLIRLVNSSKHMQTASKNWTKDRKKAHWEEERWFGVWNCRVEPWKEGTFCPFPT